MTYMTRQQQAILTCIQSCDGGIGAAELTETLHRQYFFIQNIDVFPRRWG